MDEQVSTKQVTNGKSDKQEEDRASTQWEPLDYPPLLRCSPLFEGESLSSYLIRLAEQNTCTPLRLIKWSNKLLRQRGIDDQIQLPRSKIAFQLLMALTTLPVEHLYKASPHIYANILNPARPWNELWASPPFELPTPYLLPLLQPSGLTNTQRVSNNACRYCPLCLAEQPYQRLIWTFASVAVCLNHNCFLIARCPSCDQRLHVASIAYARCRRCRADLASTLSQPCLPEDALWWTQELLQAWLGNRVPKICNIEYGLPNLDSALLFHLVVSLRGAWKRSPLPADPTQTYKQMGFAINAIARWPYSLLNIAGRTGQFRINFIKRFRATYTKGREIPFEGWLQKALNIS